MSRVALCTLLLAGCGASCPEPTTTANDNRDPDGEIPARPTPASGGAFAGFDGRWFLVEPDDDEVEVVMEIHGATGSLFEDDPTEAISLQLEQRPGGLAMIRLDEPGSERGRAFLVPRGPHSMLAFRVGDDDALIARREGPLPAFLQGRWELASLNDARTITMDVQGSTARMMMDDELRAIELIGLMSDGPTHDVVGQRTDGRGGEMNWLRISEADPGVYLVTEGNDEEFRVMYRPGAAPAWLAEARRPDAPREMLEARPPPATAAPPEIR